MSETTYNLLADLLDEALAERLLEADGLSRFPVMDLIPDDTLDEQEDFKVILMLERLDLRLDVSTWTTFAGSLEEPPEYASGGDWALLEGPNVVDSGRIRNEGEWEGDPFSLLRS